MPQTLYDVEGNEKEVLTDAEIEALKSPQDALKSVMTELGLEVGDNVTEKLDDLKNRVKELKEAENPNWKAARQKISSLENLISNLKSQGKNIDDKGNIIDDNKNFTAEDIEKKAQLAARGELLSEKIEDTLSVYNEDEQRVIKHYFNKLSAGEDLTLRNVDKFLAESIKLANVDNGSISAEKKSASRIGSSSSSYNGASKNFADTDAGKGVLNLMGIKTTEDKK